MTPVPGCATSHGAMAASARWASPTPRTRRRRLACLDPPGLVAQVLDCGGFVNSWRSGIRQSGAFELKQATWAFKNALVSPEAEADPVMRAALAGEDIREWFTRMPWKPGHSPLRHHPDYEAYLFDQWTHGAFDEFWQQLGICTERWHERYSRAACVHMSSWWDPYPLTATGNYTGLKRAGRGPQRLILGPGRMAIAAIPASATSSSAPMRRSIHGPATGAPIGCASSTMW